MYKHLFTRSIKISLLLLTSCIVPSLGSDNKNTEFRQDNVLRIYYEKVTEETKRKKEGPIYVTKKTTPNQLKNGLGFSENAKLRLYMTKNVRSFLNATSTDNNTSIKELIETKGNLKKKANRFGKVLDSTQVGEQEFQKKVKIVYTPDGKEEVNNTPGGPENTNQVSSHTDNTDEDNESDSLKEPISQLDPTTDTHDDINPVPLQPSDTPTAGSQPKDITNPDNAPVPPAPKPPTPKLPEPKNPPVDNSNTPTDPLKKDNSSKYIMGALGGGFILLSLLASKAKKNKDKKSKAKVTLSTKPNKLIKSS